jgi:hypothetical protein
MSILCLCLPTLSGPTLFHHQYVHSVQSLCEAHHQTQLEKHQLPAHSVSFDPRSKLERIFSLLEPMCWYQLHTRLSTAISQGLIMTSAFSLLLSTFWV